MSVELSTKSADTNETEEKILLFQKNQKFSKPGNEL